MSMQVTFDGASYDIGTLTHKDIGTPQPDFVLYRVPGSSVPVDMSRALTGDITYGTRQITMTFEKFANMTQREQIRRTAMALHGTSRKVVFQSDPDWYYYGRVTVSFAEDGSVLTTTVTVDADPYKRKAAETSASTALTASAKTLTVTNAEMPVVPEVSCTGTTKIVHEGKTFNLSAGTYLLPDLVLRKGENALSVSGSGTLTIKFREGRL